jgi:urease accessory protein
MRGDGPFVFAQARHGVGLDAIIEHLLSAWRIATAAPTPRRANFDGS